MYLIYEAKNVEIQWWTVVLLAILIQVKLVCYQLAKNDACALWLYLWQLLTDKNS